MAKALLTLGFSGVLAALIACWIKIKPATSRLRSVLFRGANILVSVLLILLVAALFIKTTPRCSAITKSW
ncbi:phosphoethanolamine transferase domain-containing protein [Escherichia coli]